MALSMQCTNVHNTAANEKVEYLTFWKICFQSEKKQAWNKYRNIDKNVCAMQSLLPELSYCT